MVLMVGQVRRSCEHEAKGQELKPLKDQLRTYRRLVETDIIRRALEKTRGNITSAANVLKISRKGLQRKMKAYGLRA